MLKSILEYARDYGDKKWHQTTFQYIRYAVYIVTAIAFTGVVTIDPKYIYILETIIEVYVAIFLMLKFNPLVEHKKSLSAFDRQMAWTAGVFLFFTSIVGAAIKTYMEYKFVKVKTGAIASFS